MRRLPALVSVSAPCLFLALGLASLPGGPARAAQTVTVKLQDPSTGGGIDKMQMVVNPATVKAGSVTIQATNQSQRLVHEVIVVAPSDGKPLPYDNKTNRVIESQIRDLGEISDLPPGKAGKLTVTLRPGSYLLICNQPTHYKAGMWSHLTVTP